MSAFASTRSFSRPGRGGRHFGIAWPNWATAVDPDQFERVYNRFISVADRKKEIGSEDLSSIVEIELTKVPETFSFHSLQIMSGNTMVPLASVTLTKDGEQLTDAATGNGPGECRFQLHRPHCRPAGNSEGLRSQGGHHGERRSGRGHGESGNRECRLFGHRYELRMSSKRVPALI